MFQFGVDWEEWVRLACSPCTHDGARLAVYFIMSYLYTYYINYIDYIYTESVHHLTHLLFD